MSELLQGSMVDRYLQCSKNDQQKFIISYFLADPLRYVPLWQLLDVYSIDQLNFKQALETVLAASPAHEMALRFMVWIKIREGDFEAAIILQKLLIEILPNEPIERRKLLRIGLLSPNLITTKLVELGKAGLNTALSQISYRYQIARALRSTTLSVDISDLREVMHVTGQSLREQISRDAARRDTSSPLTELLNILHGARRIALVGNGPSLRGQQRGQEIDRYDIVIRFNFPIIQDFGIDVGSKTDVVVFTEALLREFEKRVSNETCYRTVHLASVENTVAAAGLDPETVAAASGTRIARFPSMVHELVKDISYDNLTTGMMMYLLFSCLLQKNITLFGFDFYSKNRSHYFGNNVPPWLGHEVQYERFVFGEMVKPVFGAYSR